MSKTYRLLITGVKRKLASPEDIFLLAARSLRLPRKALTEVTIKRKAIDARHKERISIVYTLEAVIDGQHVRNIHSLTKIPGVQPVPPEDDWLESLPRPLGKKVHPIVIGNGPAGLFAAALLAAQGTSPIVLERGSRMDKRVQDVENFWSRGVLAPESNVQFGEGGAGTFSDGKLTTRIRDARIDYVLATLADAGAGKDIVYQQRPHVGTDRLRLVVEKMRKRLENAGVHFAFETRVDDLLVEDGTLRTLTAAGQEYSAADGVVLAIGNAARDTFQLLHDKGLPLAAKPFAVGLRIEHPRAFIDEAQYGALAGNRELGAACYNFTWTGEDGRGAYTFCMCPGGQVIGAASETGGLVVNGMSLYNRRQDNSNSAIVVNVGPGDFGDTSLAGMHFQRELEKKAFTLGGGSYGAPVQRLGDFLSGVASSGPGVVRPSYRPGFIWTDLTSLLPAHLTQAITQALQAFASKLPGFAMADAVLTGVETRTSSPVRILRGENGASLGATNLFPAGEGAGYAGGIVSSAVDGLRAAENLLRTL